MKARAARVSRGCLRKPCTATSTARSASRHPNPCFSDCRLLDLRNSPPSSSSGANKAACFSRPTSASSAPTPRRSRRRSRAFISTCSTISGRRSALRGSRHSRLQTFSRSSPSRSRSAPRRQRDRIPPRRVAQPGRAEAGQTRLSVDKSSSGKRQPAFLLVTQHDPSSRATSRSAIAAARS